jgi:hypothetical protein
VALKGAVQYVVLTGNASSNGTAAVGWGSNKLGTDNCARTGIPVGTSPASLDVTFSTGNTSRRATDVAGISMLSGQYLPEMRVTVLDALGQAYLDASVISLVLTTASSARIEGRASSYGSFGYAEFPANAVRLYAKPGAHRVNLTSDDLFSQYPSSRLRRTLLMTVLPCPPSRYVVSESLECVACPTGRISTMPESTSCSSPASDSFTIDGASTRSCSEPDLDTQNAASVILLADGSVASSKQLAQQRALELKQMQCPKASGPPVQVMAPALTVPMLVIVAGLGTFGILYYRRAIRMAEAGSATWLVNPKEIQWLSKIGEGAYGEVFMCKYRETIVCVKRVKVASNKDAPKGERAIEEGREAIHANVTRAMLTVNVHDNPQIMEQLEKEDRQLQKANIALAEEIELHVSLKHPNIVIMMGAVVQSNNAQVCLMTEFMDLGGLDGLLTNKEFPLPLPIRIKFCKEITSGLSYLHLNSPPILHCDLKSANILVSSDLVVKLADFGLSTLKVQSALNLQSKLNGTILYMVRAFFLSVFFFFWCCFCLHAYLAVRLIRIVLFIC